MHFCLTHDFPGLEILTHYHEGGPGHLRDGGILTEITAKITTRGGNGVGFGSGQHMEERLFFNGINVLGDKGPINQTVKGAIPVFPNAA
jgi:hypothetical protein